MTSKERRSELRDLRQRFREAKATSNARARDLALRLRTLRQQMATLMGDATACSGCASGCGLPEGRWDGGYCCSTATEAVFNGEEVFALALAGTRFRDLKPVKMTGGGCAFRGPKGCTLTAENRPTLCVRYACTDLRRDLHRRGLLDAAERLEDEMADVYLELTNLRR